MIDMNSIPYDLFLSVYDGKDIKKSLKYSIEVNTHELTQLGIEYVTDGEGFENVTKFTIPEFANDSILEKDQKLIDEFREKMLNGAEMLQHRFNRNGGKDLTPNENLMEAYQSGNLKPVVEDMVNNFLEKSPSVTYVLNHYDRHVATTIAKSLIMSIIVTNDVLNSIEKYKRAVEKDDIDLEDIEYLFHHKVKAHSKDKYYCKVRKGELWTLGQGIVKSIEYNLTMAQIKTSAIFMKGKK